MLVEGTHCSGRKAILLTTLHYGDVIKARWRLKSPASQLFTQLFIRVPIKENIKAPRHWPLHQLSIYITHLGDLAISDGKTSYILMYREPEAKLLRSVIYRLCFTSCSHSDTSDVIFEFDSFTLQWRHNGTMASQITSLAIVYSTVYSDANKKKHQSSASLSFVRGIHRGPVNSPHKWPVTRNMFPFDNVIMSWPYDKVMWFILIWFFSENWENVTPFKRQ